MDKSKLKKLLIGAALVVAGAILQKKYLLADKIPGVNKIA